MANKWGTHPQPKRYTPTPQHIRVECEQIQRAWGRKEESKRRGKLEGSHVWDVPVVDVSRLPVLASRKARHDLVEEGDG